MEEMDMRNMLLSELIDKMHGRLADKLYPVSSEIPMPNPSEDDKPAAASIPGTEAATDEKMIDVDHDADEPTDEEIEEMLRQ
jgi:hypothetical protein